MNSIVQIFDKMNSKLKSQIIIIIVGLIMPSLVYLVLNFPVEFYELDLLKVTIMCICINFSTICLFTFLNLLKYLIGYKKHSTFLLESLEYLKSQSIELESKLKLQSAATKTISQEIQVVDKLILDLESYINELLNPLKHISESSLAYTLYTIFISIINIIFDNTISFSAKGILGNVYMFYLSYFAFLYIADKYDKNPKFNTLNESINSLKQYFEHTKPIQK